jgi:hypothetical protein
MVVWSLIRSQQDVFRLACRIYFIVAISDLIALISCLLTDRRRCHRSRLCQRTPSLSKCSMASICNRGTQLPPSSKINLSDEVEIAGWEVVGEGTSDSAAKGRSVFSESGGVEDPGRTEDERPRQSLVSGTICPCVTPCYVGKRHSEIRLSYLRLAIPGSHCSFQSAVAALC